MRAHLHLNVVVIGALFFGCESSTQPPPYQILKEQHQQPYDHYNFTISIPKKYTEPDLRAITDAILKIHPNAERTRIWFFPPLYKVGEQIPYCISLMENAKLSLEIRGSSSSEDSLMAQKALLPVEGAEVLGAFDFRVTFEPHVLVLYKRNGKTYLHKIYKDGSQGKVEPLSEMNGNSLGLQTNDMQESNEYYKLEDENLAYYTRENKLWFLAPKVAAMP